MCGRYVLKATLEELQKKYGAVPDGVYEFRANYNVAPSAQMPVIINDEGEYKIKEYRWGLVPPWAESVHTGYSMINARSETLDKKRSFKKPLQKQRCIVPANGFYEWKKSNAGKIPYLITDPTDSLMSFAGLYETWQHDPENVVHSFTIITTPANKTLSELHDRMPAILLKDEIHYWLNHQQADTGFLLDLLKPWPDDGITFFRVDQKVNSVKYNGPDCIAPYRDLFS